MFESSISINSHLSQLFLFCCKQNRIQFQFHPSHFSPVSQLTVKSNTGTASAMCDVLLQIRKKKNNLKIMNKSQLLRQCCPLRIHITSLNYSAKKSVESNPIAEYINMVSKQNVKSPKTETCVGSRAWQRGKARWDLQSNINQVCEHSLKRTS